MLILPCTEAAAWVTQQARQLVWKLQDEERVMRFVLHDRDAKFPASFDAVFAAEGTQVILTPYRAPNANAYAERWVRSVREECLDHLLIINEQHLHLVLCEYGQYYNQARPHQGLRQQIPAITTPPTRTWRGAATRGSGRAYP
jgi:putative transposase